MRDWLLDIIYRIFRKVIYAGLVLSIIYRICRCIAYAGLVFIYHLPHNQVNSLCGIDVFIYIPHIMMHCIRGNGAYESFTAYADAFNMRDSCLDISYRIIRSVSYVELMFRFIYRICMCISYAGLMFGYHLSHIQTIYLR